MIAIVIVYLATIVVAEAVVQWRDELRTLVAKHKSNVLAINKAHAFQMQGLHVAHGVEIQDIETRHAAELVFKVKLLGEKLSAEMIDEAKKEAAYVQMRFEKLLGDFYARNPQFGSSAEWRGIVKFVQDNLPCMTAYVSDPVIEFGGTSRLDFNSRVRTKRIDMLKFEISIGLSEETPPELVAQQIAERLRLVILKKWQSQSLLLAGAR